MGAWIETSIIYSQQMLSESHPVWVRGLKPVNNTVFVLVRLVAPRVGAWIETVRRCRPYPLAKSHPVWVRGLKQIHSYDLLNS